NAAFIGAGFIGKVQIAQILRLYPKVKIAGLAEANPAAGQEIAREFGIERVTGDYRELLDDKNIQVIHNCTPNNLHHKINKEALECGKHVFSEKPLALTATEGIFLSELAENRHLEAGVNFCYRFYPVIQEAKERIKNGEIGEVFSVMGYFLQDWLLFNTDYNWRLTRESSGNSYIMADLGSHWCDLIQFVTGLKITSLTADLRAIHPVRKKPKSGALTFARQTAKDMVDVKCDLDDYGALLLRFDKGARGAFMTSSLCAGRKVSIDLQIYGSKQSLSWNHERSAELLVGNRDKANEIFIESPLQQKEATRKYALLPSGHPMGYHDALFNLFSDFYGAVEKNMSGEKAAVNYPTFKEAAYELKIAAAAVKSSREGQWQEIK
ncbi:MAG: Gfo/Idh/MocA family oxidoreductase, partial [Kiritimatiellae bacterium]|nr:Gfo/Idh/MocA family oxidoreductase [Kiritimatiellia bacterium]